MPGGHDDVVRGFAAACRPGTIAALLAVLHTDAVAICDGGGLVPAPLGPIHGAEHVARLVAALLGGMPGTDLTVESVNGLAGLALRRFGRAVAVVGVATAGTKVATVWIVLNPAKLRRWHLR
jgi:RNA polymerase sigma-70 factor (ECF subfamily)